VVHDRGYLIAAPPGGGGVFAFYRPDGVRLPSCPPLPEPDGPIGQVHDADITPETIIPPWYGTSGTAPRPFGINVLPPGHDGHDARPVRAFLPGPGTGGLTDGAGP
jgi:hypothetical protein